MGRQVSVKAVVTLVNVWLCTSRCCSTNHLLYKGILHYIRTPGTFQLYRVAWRYPLNVSMPVLVSVWHRIVPWHSGQFYWARIEVGMQCQDYAQKDFACLNNTPWRFTRNSFYNKHTYLSWGYRKKSHGFTYPLRLLCYSTFRSNRPAFLFIGMLAVTSINTPQNTDIPILLQKN